MLPAVIGFVLCSFLQWLQLTRSTSGIAAPWRPLSLSLSEKSSMDSAVSFLAFGLQIFVLSCLILSCLTCPAPFQVILGVCLYISAPTERLGWCDAQASCMSINGELVRGSSFMPLNGINFSSDGMPDVYWIGLTDFLQERGRWADGGRSGWRWSDGSIDPPSSDLAWKVAEPSTISQDCVRQCRQLGQLCSDPCAQRAQFICKQWSQPISAAGVKMFQSVSISVGLAADHFAENDGCWKLLTKVESEIECARVCSGEPKDSCVAFYFNETRRECRLVLHTDATVDMGNAEGWKKFVMKK